MVVGAGAAGVPAALSAFEAGAKVALLQKEATAISQGNTCDSIILDQTDPAGVEAVVSLITEDCCHRSDREQVRLWAYNSGEALQWLWDIAQKAGAQVVDSTAKWTGPIKQIDGYDITYFAFDFGPKPYNTGNGMRDIGASAGTLTAMVRQPAFSPESNPAGASSTTAQSPGASPNSSAPSR